MFKKDQKSEGFVAEFGDESGVPINLAKEKVRKMVIFISPNMSQNRPLNTSPNMVIH